MRPVTVSCAYSLLAIPVASPLFAAEPPKGFTPLFNGKDLDGWHGWAIHAKGASPADAREARPRGAREEDRRVDRRREEALERRERRTGQRRQRRLPRDRQGVRRHRAADRLQDRRQGRQRHLPARHAAGADLGHEPRKFDGKRPNRADKGSGGLFNNAQGAPGRDPLVLADKPFGEWNTFRILQVGERTTVYLNDKLVVDHARMENFWDKQAKLNPLRRCRQRADPAPDARRRDPLAEHLRPRDPRDRGERDPPQARGRRVRESVFNGKDFTGWAGALENYEVVDGAIVCKPGKGGNIFTKEEYADFAVRLEYKLPAGGNNGLAIRYPGDGPAVATQAMCETPDPRRHRDEVREARPAAVQRLGLRHGRGHAAATCGRSASGTSWR